MELRFFNLFYGNALFLNGRVISTSEVYKEPFGGRTSCPFANILPYPLQSLPVCVLYRATLIPQKMIKYVLGT